jgi:ribonuclease D
MYRESISKDELEELPLQQFGGDIFLIDNEEDYQVAVDFLSKQEMLGFDTETKPSFKKGCINQVALLQLATQNKAFLFRLNHIGLNNGVKSILQDPKIKKVGVAIRDDIKTLQRLSGFKPAGFIELQEQVKNYGIQNFSLKKLTAIVLGFRISKSQRLSNWEAPMLTEAQQNYAATDAWVSYMIYQSLNN